MSQTSLRSLKSVNFIHQNHFGIGPNTKLQLKQNDMVPASSSIVPTQVLLKLVSHDASFLQLV